MSRYLVQDGVVDAIMRRERAEADARLDGLIEQFTSDRDAELQQLLVSAIC